MWNRSCQTDKGLSGLQEGPAQQHQGELNIFGKRLICLNQGIDWGEESRGSA